MYNLDIEYEEFLKKELEKCPELNLKDIEMLRERVKLNKELPPIRDKLIVVFLHSCYFNVDTAYKTIVAYCKYQREVPQVFIKFDPSSEAMQKVFETM